MIPHVAHFYWGQTDLPFLRFLTLWSFGNLNPDWTLVLHEPDQLADTIGRRWNTHEHKASRQSVRNYRPLLGAIPNLRIRKHPSDGFPPHLSQVHRSDLLRWALLANEGGVWSDMDIAWLRPLSDLRLPDATSAVLCYSLLPDFLTHSIGFLASTAGAWPFTDMMQRSIEIASSASSAEEYQMLGCQLLMKVAPLGRHLPRGVYNLPIDVVYPYSWVTIQRFLATAEQLATTPNTIGIHWYAGNRLATHLAAELTHDAILTVKTDEARYGLTLIVRDILSRFPIPGLPLGTPSDTVLSTHAPHP